MLDDTSRVGVDGSTVGKGSGRFSALGEADDATLVGTKLIIDYYAGSGREREHGRPSELSAGKRLHDQ